MGAVLGLAAMIALAGCDSRTEFAATTSGTGPAKPASTTGQPQPVLGSLDDFAANREYAPAPPPSAEQYPLAKTNPVKLVAEEPVSTFSIDVDTAAYANVRRYLQDGELPPADAVRAEEMVNYFDYAYPVPIDSSVPFSTTVSVMPTPWNPDTRLLRIGLKGYDIARKERPRANLVFLVDVSGSMDSPDKLPLVQQVLRLMVKELRDDDTVGIVTYAGTSGVALEPTQGADRREILAAIDSLGAGGSTAGAAGIVGAYDLALRNFDKEAVNRVILATDGDFNVGLSDPKALEQLITDKRRTGIYLSVLGFGTGNLNDSITQALAQAGNGNAAYIDGLLEGRKVLVDEMGSTLFPIANDVKIQIEFNPAQVAAYRLIGYETRMLNREDFNDDAIDAGEIGSGHTVTALYEITPVGAARPPIDSLRYGSASPDPQPVASAAGRLADEIAFLKLRYKLPGAPESRLIERPITVADGYDSVAAAPEDLRFAAAVAGFAQLLRGDSHLHRFGYDDVVALADPARGDDPFGYRAEFVQMARQIATAQTAAQ
jgi:Ca-activated chloride channel family protein